MGGRPANTRLGRLAWRVRRALLIAVVGLGFASLSPVALAEVARADAPHPARVVVQQTTEKVLAALRAEPRLKEQPARLRALVEREVLGHFDFRRMSRAVMGPLWKQANSAERTQFVREFRALLTKTYASALVGFSEQTVTYFPVRARGKGKRAIVPTKVHGGARDPVSVNYSMSVRDGVWKVYDVTVGGPSLVAIYRSTFRNEVRARGFAGLLARLEEKNREF